jgi:hypothetical protein
MELKGAWSIKFERVVKARAERFDVRAEGARISAKQDFSE